MVINFIQFFIYFIKKYLFYFILMKINVCIIFFLIEASSNASYVFYVLLFV